MDKLAHVLILEQGKPFRQSQIKIEGAARYFEEYEIADGCATSLGKEYCDFTT